MDPANYCGIIITTVILKVTEHILNRRHNAILDKSQSSLQKGFTAGRSSIDAALILSECTAEIKNSHKPLIVAMLDAQKALRWWIMTRSSEDCIWMVLLVQTGCFCETCTLTSLLS